MVTKTRLTRFAKVASDANMSKKAAVDAAPFVRKMFNASTKKRDKFLWNDILMLIGTL